MRKLGDRIVVIDNEADLEEDRGVRVKRGTSQNKRVDQKVRADQAQGKL